MYISRGGFFMDGALFFSPIDIHFWITVLLAMVILVIYAIHARLLVKLWHWIYNLAVTVCAKISKKEAKKSLLWKAASG